MKSKWLTLLVALFLLVGCTKAAPKPETPPPVTGGPGTTDPVPPKPPTYPEGVLVTHKLEELPAPVKTWAQNLLNTTVGASMKHEGRIWLVASIEEGTIGLASAAVKDGKLVAAVTGQGSGKYALGSIGGVGDHPVEFRWQAEPGQPQAKYTAPDMLPQVNNRHNLPLPALSGKAVVLQPQANQSISGAITIAGFARHLFEGNIVARLTTQGGQEVAVQHTTASACCFDWGSFQMTLNHSAAPGSYLLLIGDYSAATGNWVTFVQIPVQIQ